MKPVASGLSHGPRIEAAHAARAVRAAMKRAGLTRANGVLLFLTPHYARDPSAALRAAARESGTLAIAGCTAAGVLTEDDWLLDAPGAAAMVFGGRFGFPLRPDEPAGNSAHAPVISFVTPTGMNAEWLDRPVARLGAVSGDLTGSGPFRVFANCRVADSGHAELLITNTRAGVAVSQGVRALTSPIEIADVNGYDLLKLGNYPALNVLVKSLPTEVRAKGQIPLHLLMGGVALGDPQTAIREGRFRLNHIVAANPKEQSITLATRPSRGEKLFWAMRDAIVAERDMRLAVMRAAGQLQGRPDFALLFPCMGRGPGFYGPRDRDVDCLRASFPNLPFIGFYGNGEIGPLDDENHLYQYSTVVGLFREQHTHA